LCSHRWPSGCVRSNRVNSKNVRGFQIHDTLTEARNLWVPLTPRNHHASVPVFVVYVKFTVCVVSIVCSLMQLLWHIPRRSPWAVYVSWQHSHVSICCDLVFGLWSEFISFFLGLCTQDYKYAHVAAVICATLVNTQTHSFWPVILWASCGYFADIQALFWSIGVVFSNGSILSLSDKHDSVNERTQ